MLPGSGAGAAGSEQQQQQAATTGQDRHLIQPQSPLRAAAAAGAAGVATVSSSAVLQQEWALQRELDEMRAERLLLKSQVAQLSELAQQQEDRLAVNDELLTALTTGLLDTG
jgi:hypothetical protein